MKLLERLSRMRFLSRNARAPGRTFVGAKASQFMTKVNRQTSEDAARRLGVGTNHCVLELGPGSGWGIRALAAAKPKRLVGVEISPRFRAELSAVQLPVKLELFGEDAIDMRAFLSDGAVDRLLAVNVVYFLDPLPAYAAELYRVMATGGQGILACKLDRVQDNHDDVFVNKDQKAIVGTFEDAGFTVSAEAVDLGDPLKNYTAIHIRKTA